MPATPFRNVCNIIFGVCATPNFSISRHGWLNFRMRVSKAVLVFLVEIHTFSYQKTMDWPPPPHLVMVLYLFSQHLFFTILRETNQFLHIRKFLTGQIPPLPPSHIGAHIDFLQNFHQFLWIFWWFEFSIEFSPSFSPILVKCLVNWRNWWKFKL